MNPWMKFDRGEPDPFGLAIDRIDVRSRVEVTRRLLERGLRAERVEAWRGEATTSVRLRAPAGVWPTALDAPPGPWATAWARDACRSEAHVGDYAVAYRRTEYDLDDLMERLGRCYPTPEVVDAAIAAVLATVEPARSSERLATVEEVASVLGCAVEALRARMRRGDVRSVAVGRRRTIPWSEVERLVKEGGS